MFDIGFFELMLIGIVGLLVLGPERLPVAARTAGLWLGRIRRSVSNVQREISAQLEAEELRQKVSAQQKKLDDGVESVRRGVENSITGKSSTSHDTRDEESGIADTADAPRDEARVGEDAAPSTEIPQPTSGVDRMPANAEPPLEDKDSRNR